MNVNGFFLFVISDLVLELVGIILNGLDTPGRFSTTSYKGL